MINAKKRNEEVNDEDDFNGRELDKKTIEYAKGLIKPMDFSKFIPKSEIDISGLFIMPKADYLKHLPYFKFGNFNYGNTLNPESLKGFHSNPKIPMQKPLTEIFKKYNLGKPSESMIDFYQNMFGNFKNEHLIGVFDIPEFSKIEKIPLYCLTNPNVPSNITKNDSKSKCTYIYQYLVNGSSGLSTITISTYDDHETFDIILGTSEKDINLIIASAVEHYNLGHVVQGMIQFYDDLNETDAKDK